MRGSHLGTAALRAGPGAVTECAFFGEDARFHHVGLAVRSIRDVDPAYTVIPDEELGVSMAFLTLGGITIELLEPTGDESPIAVSLRQGQKLLHLCYEVPDLDEALKHCRSAGFSRISQLARQPVYDDRRVVWVFSKHYGLFELLESVPHGEQPG